MIASFIAAGVRFRFRTVFSTADGFGSDLEPASGMPDGQMLHFCWNLALEGNLRLQYQVATAVLGRSVQ